MKRPSQAAPPTKGGWSCPDPAFKKAYPLLSQGMCDLLWDDGKPRAPWTLTLRFDGSAVNSCVNDKELSMGMYTSGSSVEDVLGLVEAALAAGTASWRRWRK